MKRLFTISALLLIWGIIWVLPAHSQQKGFNKSKIENLERYFEKSMKEWGIPGMAIGIFSDGNAVLSSGYGVRSLDNAVKVDSRTMFGIASNTKAFTASAISLLVAEGKLSWDDPVIKHLPYFELYDPYVTKNMTVRDLLCHRSGFETFSGDLLWHSTIYSREEIVKRAKFLKPKYGFREHYGYSNIMFLAAGELIPAVAGISYDDFLYDHFFRPLSMTRTNISVKHHKGEENLAIPHTKVDGKVIPIKYISWDNIAPAGGINSCVDDMLKWIALWLNEGKTGDIEVIPADQIEEMWSGQTLQKIRQTEKFLFPSVHFHAYGLGWDTFDYHGLKIVNHSGGLDGMISHTVLVPEENFGFVILTNSTNYLPYTLVYKIIDEYLGVESKDYSSIILNLVETNERFEEQERKLREKERKLDTKPSLPLEKYTGLYSSELYGDAEVSFKENNLVIQFIPAPEFVSSLDHYQDDIFRVKFNAFPSLPEGRLTFSIGSKGEVNSMLIDIPNPDFDFTELDFVKKR